MFPHHHGVKPENEYPGSRRLMSVGHPSSKISTRFNPNLNCLSARPLASVKDDIACGTLHLEPMHPPPGAYGTSTV